jgi:pimeloyl-ACP methyl ester carboxylesterase
MPNTITLIEIAAAFFLGSFLTLVVVQRRHNRAQLRSTATRVWVPGTGSMVRSGNLEVRVLPQTEVSSDGDPALVLVHGLATTGKYWGAMYDTLATHRTVLAPDLLGFGGSQDPDRTPEEYGLPDHAHELWRAIDQLTLPDQRVVICGHSLGGLVGLHAAAMRPARVQSLILISAPLHDEYETAITHIERRGIMVRWFGTDRWTARLLWKTICPRPKLAMSVSRLVSPHLPTELSRETIRHSWAAYIGTLRGALGHRTWREDMRTLAKDGCSITLVRGDRDHTLERQLYEDREDGVDLLECARAGHQLPLTQPEWCVELLENVMTGTATIEPASPPTT